MRVLTRNFLVAASLLMVCAPAQAAKGGMPQLDPTWIASQLFWLAVTFSVLYALTTWNIIPKVSRVINMRDKALRDNLAAAGANKEEAEAARAAFEKAIIDARRASAETIALVQAESNATLAAKQAELDAKLKEQMQASNATIALSLARVKSEVAPAAASLASDICSKLLGQKISDADVKKHLG